jgi:type IV pilus assembly protein PilO
MTLVRRVVADRRRAVLPLGVAFAVNILLYAVVVYPLSQRVANVEERERAAEQAHANARREYDAARGALTGKDRASAELGIFYKDVLPADLAGARRLTHLRLAQLAREANLRHRTTRYEESEQRDSTLRRFEIEMVLEGSYDDMRTFIYQLETAPEFVVVDDVTLTEGADEAGALVLNVKMSTYFRAPQA